MNVNYNFGDLADQKVATGGETLKKSKSERHFGQKAKPTMSVSNSVGDKSIKSRANFSVLDSVLDGSIQV